MSGMAYIAVVFESPHESGARTASHPRACGKRCPRGCRSNVRLQVGPAASSTGWVFQYVLVDRFRKMRGLRNVQDGVSRPSARRCPGVAEVASVGGGRQPGAGGSPAGAARAREVSPSRTVVSALQPGGAGSGEHRAARAYRLACRMAASTPRASETLPICKLTRDMPDRHGGLQRRPVCGGRHRGGEARRRSGRARRARQACDRGLRPRLPRGRRDHHGLRSARSGDARRTYARCARWPRKSRSWCW